MPPPVPGVSTAHDTADNPEVRRLSVENVRTIAKLARLELSEDQVHQYRGQLSAVLGYMDQLRAIDTAGVEPMTHPGVGTHALEDDAPRVPSETIPVRAFLDMAPETLGQFVRVPKVLGEGGGA